MWWGTLRACARGGDEARAAAAKRRLVPFALKLRLWGASLLPQEQVRARSAAAVGRPRPALRRGCSEPARRLVVPRAAGARVPRTVSGVARRALVWVKQNVVPAAAWSRTGRAHRQGERGTSLGLLPRGCGAGRHGRETSACFPLWALQVLGFVSVSV